MKYKEINYQRVKEIKTASCFGCVFNKFIIDRNCTVKEVNESCGINQTIWKLSIAEILKKL